MKKAIIAAAATTLLSSSLAQADSFAIGPKVGTQGIGIEGRIAINENFIARLGGNYFTYKKNYSESDLRYKGKLHLLTVPLMLDFHPMADSGFRVSAGVAYNDNHLKATATPNRSVTINGHTYTAQQIGQVNAKLTLGSKFAGLASVGYDSSLVSPSPFSFSFELGVMFSGNPKLRVTSTGLVTGTQELEDLKSNAKDALDGIRKYLRFYPVLSIGAKYSL